MGACTGLGAVCARCPRASAPDASPGLLSRRRRHPLPPSTETQLQARIRRSTVFPVRSPSDRASDHPPIACVHFHDVKRVFNGNGRQQGWKVTRAWQVGRPSANTHPAEAVGGMHNLEELPPSETEAMLDREQMHRTRREPVCLNFISHLTGVLHDTETTIVIVGRREPIVGRV